MVKDLEPVAQGEVVGATLNRQRPLPHGRDPVLGVERQEVHVFAFGELEPKQAGHRQDNHIAAPGILNREHALQTGLHIAPDGLDASRRPAAERQTGSTKARRPDVSGRLRQGRRAPFGQRPRHDAVPNIAPLGDGADDEAFWSRGGHVFEAVNGEVNLTGQERVLEFAREEPLAAEISERAIEEKITGGLEDDVAGPKVRVSAREETPDGFRLPQGERRATGPDS